MKCTLVGAAFVGTLLSTWAFGQQILFAETFLAGEGGVAVDVFQTSGRREFRAIPTTPFSTHICTQREPLDIDAAEVRGHYRGLGVSMTDASCWLLSRLTSEKRRALLEAVFSPKGAALGWVRLNIGASDYSTGLYTYDDWANDVEMRHFSVKRDDNWVFPMVKEALAINPGIVLFASPWSPPAWMKTSNTLTDGGFKDGCEEAMANYLVAYVKACRERGLDLKAVTVQNESAYSTKGCYPSCVYTDEQEAAVSRRFAAKAKDEGLSTKVWLWDWNTCEKEMPERLRHQLANDETRAAIGGVAWHSYGQCSANLEILKREYPEIPFYHTEMGPALGDSGTSGRTPKFWCGKVAEMLENGCETFTSWNLCLDAEGGPTTGPYHCAGFVEVDVETGTFTPSPQYHLFRHIGPFVKPGAEVLRVKGDRDGLGVLLFRNPDGAYVLVVAAGADGGVEHKDEPDVKQRPRLYVKLGDEMKQLSLPPDTWSVTTMVFRRRIQKDIVMD